MVDVLIKARANVAARDGENFTPLMIAVSFDHLEILDILLKGKANPNDVDKILPFGPTLVQFLQLSLLTLFLTLHPL